MSRARLILSACLWMAGAAPAALAAPIADLFDTGLDAGGAPLGYGGIDAHWTVNGGPAYAGNQAPGYWIAAGGLSDWISGSTAPPLTSSAPIAISDFRTSFTLTGALLTLFGQVAADNGITDILINGHSTGYTLGILGSPAFASFESFAPLGLASFTSFFRPGLNTLDILVNNDGCGGCINPTGLRAELFGTQASNSGVVPEPASLALLGAGLLGLAALRRRA